MRIIAIKKLDLTKVVDKSKKEHKQQTRDLKQYIKIIPGMVEKLCQQGKILYEEIKATIPGRNTGPILRQRRKEWMIKANELEGLQEFYTHVAGEENQKKVTRLLCDIASEQILLRDGKKRLITWATNYFKNQSTQEKRTPFEESGYTEQLLQFLPKQIYFDLGPNRELLEIKESFGREQKNWEIMSRKIAYIAKHYNEIIKDIKQDLQSPNESTRLLALMMAITIETGLRPGAIGNAAKVVDPETGEKIEIDTFGVTTLQAEHVKSIKDGFAELQFPGKKGTTQIATLSDNDIVNALQQIIASIGQGQPSMLFVTKNGDHIDDYQLRKYAKEKWHDISPTDFRKFMATKTFYQHIKIATEEFKLKLIDQITNGQKLIKSSIVDSIVKMMEQAIENTKGSLSHKEGHDAWQTYISPKIILAYLANGELSATLEEILIDNKTVRFSFDVNDFVKFANELSDEEVNVEDDTQLQSEQEAEEA